jgi:hypothetical protein
MTFTVRLRAAFCGALLFAAACTDSNPAATPPAPVPDPTQQVSALSCAVDVRASTLACRSAQPGGASDARSVILGGQGVNVRLASSGTAYDAGTGILSSDVTVENLTMQMLGTTDGLLPDPAGIRVFFASGPTVTDGTGTVTVENADGTATFTAGGQSYIQYPGILAPGDTSAPEEWRFAVSPTVVSFSFTVFVAAPVLIESGWVSLTPVAPTMSSTQTLRLNAVVRSVTGQPVAGAKVTWSWSAVFDDVVATLDSTGLLRVQDVLSENGFGYVEVTATSGGRTGKVRVFVTEPGSNTPPPPSIASVQVSPTLVDNDGADSVTVLVAVSDPAGVNFVSVDLVPSFQQQTPQTCTSTAPASGTRTAGVFACRFGFPAGAPGGAWQVRSVSVMGNQSNRYLDEFDMRAAGVQRGIYVRGPVSDYIPPTLTGFTLSPDSVRTVFDTVTIDVAVADADTGVAQVSTTIGNGGAGPSTGCTTSQLVSGTIRNGVFRCRMRVPGFIRSENMFVETVTIRDRNGNLTEMHGSELEYRGFSTQLAVQPDTVPPTLTAFSITPTTVAANGVDSASVSMTGADSWSGVQYLEVVFKRTSDGSVRNCIGGFPYAPATGRTRTCALRFSPGAEGTYRVDFIRVSDHAGRFVSLDATQAQAAGYPVEITVTP